MPTHSEDRDAIRDLYAKYCLSIDTGATDEWAPTFTDNAEFLAGGDPLVGREALRAFASSIPSGTLHHMVLNEAIDVQGDAAEYRSSVLVMSKDAIITTGRTEDELRRVDGSWRIARRAFAPDAP